MTIAASRSLILGGTRSGKSAYAEGLLPPGAPIRYLATARVDPGDREWSDRIAAHRARRPPAWRTVETPDLAGELAESTDPVLVDDLATWLTGVLDDADAWRGGPLEPVRAEVDRLAASVRDCASRIVLVSAEVGLGVVPETRSGRLFRDELGALNARLAQVCDEVLLLVAGLPMRLKPQLERN